MGEICHSIAWDNLNKTDTAVVILIQIAFGHAVLQA